jgi:hypothetical protein
MTPEQTLDKALEALIHKANMIPVMQGNCYVIHPEAMQAVIDEAIKQALEQPEERYTYGTPLLDVFTKPAPVQESWHWSEAPVKTQWGDEMVVADLAIDKDHTVSVYCERDQIAKVEAMFTPPAAQRQWVGLTDAEVMQTMSGDWTSQFYFARAIEAKLKKENT